MSIFYALDDNNKKVYIQDAKTGQDKLKCFECGYRLIPKKGKIMRPHYAHHSDSNCVYKNIIFKSETEEHKQSKISIKNLIESNKLIIYTSCYCNRKIRFDPNKVYVSLEAYSILQLTLLAFNLLNPSVPCNPPLAIS